MRPSQHSRRASQNLLALQEGLPLILAQLGDSRLLPSPHSHMGGPPD